MRSARTDALWRSFCRHEGIAGTHHEVVQFREPSSVADRLIDEMLAGAKRVATGAMHFFGEDGKEPVPRAGDPAILLDSHKRARLIWHTTGITVGPLSSVPDIHVWHDSTGNGDRAEWLRRMTRAMTRQAREYGFEMHEEIETVFETLEIVWPYDVARRIRLVTPRLDRGNALLHRLNEQRNLNEGLEAILSRIETAVLIATSRLQVVYCNPTGEALLKRGDGLLVRNGCLSTRCLRDERRLLTAFAEVRGQCSVPNIASRPGRQPGKGIPLAIDRGDDRSPYRATVFPVRCDHAIGDLTRGAVVIMFVEDPDRDAEPGAAYHFSRAFQLTPAEARLAVHLGSGASLTEAAEAFGVTHNTVRAQLRAIFDKTDTHRQADLVRLLQSIGNLRISLR